MTAATLSHDTDHSLTFGRVTRAESIKQFTLQSTYWVLGCTVLAWVAMTWILAANLGDGDMGSGGLAVVPMATWQLPGFIFPILGALAITNEYNSGMIRSTLAAVPRRIPVLWAKALVISLVTIAAGFVALLLNAIGVLLLTPGASASALFSGSAFALYGKTLLVLVAFTLLGLGIGFLLRNTAGSVAVVLGLLYFVLILFQLAQPIKWLYDLQYYLPTQAASSILGQGGSDSLSPGVGAIVLTAWVVAALGGAAAVLRRRDV